MAKHYSTKKWLLFSAILLAALSLTASAFVFRKWINVTYTRYKIENTISSELKPLESVLSSLGFGNLKELDTNCGYNTYKWEPNLLGGAADITHSDGTYFECSSGIDRYIVVAEGTSNRSELVKHANELSVALQSNGWKSREDLLTVPWFENIAKDVDYQPDQLNTKKVGNFDCIIDFFTAFSKPKPTAISMRAYCTRISTTPLVTPNTNMGSSHDRQTEAIRQAQLYETPKGVLCTQAMVPAVHTATGAKYTFPNGCLAPGWEPEK